MQFNRSDAMPARSIGLVSPATVNGAPLSETKLKGRFGLALSVRSACNSSPSGRKAKSVTICRELSDADQIIKSKHCGTDPQLKNRTTGTYAVMREITPRLVLLGGGSA